MIRRVLFCGAWDEGDGYPRATALRLGLQRAGVAVDECRAPALGDKRRLLASPWRWPGLLLRFLFGRRRLAARLRRAVRERAPDVVVVPYPGQHLVGAVARAAGVPVVLDLFLSAYDTAVQDRAMFAPDSVPAWLLRRLDRNACRAADLVLVDTPQNVDYLATLTGLPASRFAALPIGDPQAPAAPAPYRPPADGRLAVLFFGTGVPLHGLGTLIDAVAAVPAATLVLIGGSGADRARAARCLGERLTLLPEFVPRAELQGWLDGAALVAGVFGRSDKAQRVVPFKVVHALAAGRPVITADTPALRMVLTDGEGAFLVPAGDVQALARRLRELAAAPERLAAAAAVARSVHDRSFAIERSGTRLRDLLQHLADAEVRS